VAVFFWLSVSLILYSYFGYPLVLFFLGLLKGEKERKEEITPTVSLLTSVYNEEKTIREKIENCLALDYPKDKLEIVFASDGSDDRTNAIVQEYKNRGVKLFAYRERAGKQFTLYRTVPKCSGEIIVFSDANGMFKKDAIKKLVRNFADPRVGCVSGELRYTNPQKTSIGESEGFYWKYECFVKRLESRVQSVLGANGSIYALRKKLYSPLSEYRGDDFELPVRVAQQGYGVVWESEAVSVEEASLATEEEFKRKVRIVAWNWRSAWVLLMNSVGKFQPLLVFQLISHKILRWLVGFFMSTIFVSNIFCLGYPFYRVVLVGQLIFYSLAALGYIQDRKGESLSKAINLAYYFCMVNLAAMMGVIDGVRRPQKPIWEKVR